MCGRQRRSARLWALWLETEEVSRNSGVLHLCSLLLGHLIGGFGGGEAAEGWAEATAVAAMRPAARRRLGAALLSLHDALAGTDDAAAADDDENDDDDAASGAGSGGGGGGGGGGGMCGGWARDPVVLIGLAELRVDAAAAAPDDDDGPRGRHLRVLDDILASWYALRLGGGGGGGDVQSTGACEHVRLAWLLGRREALRNEGTLAMAHLDEVAAELGAADAPAAVRVLPFCARADTISTAAVEAKQQGYARRRLLEKRRPTSPV